MTHREAAPGDLPPVLVSPPWTREPTKAKPVVVSGLSAPDSPRVAWLPGERETWSRRKTPKRWPPDTDWDAAIGAARSADNAPYRLLRLALAAPYEPGRRLITEETGSDWLDPDLAAAIAARFEVDALPLLMRSVSAQPAHTGFILLPYLSADTAELMADWLVRLKTSRGHAAAWLLRHGTDAAELLIPAALGKAGKSRRNAEAALLYLAGHHGDEPVLAAAKRHGDAAGAAIRALLATDPLDILPAKPKPLADWIDVAALPPLWSRDGEQRLPDDAVGHVITALSISKPDQMYAGVEQVREHCDPVSLAEFGWSLFQQWKNARHPNAHIWALEQLAWTGDDHTSRKLAKAMRGWHRKERVAAGLLAVTGDIAPLYLDELSRLARDSVTRWQAASRLTELAEQRGLSREELRDRLLPDAGLDADGRLLLDYGPRAFTVTLDTELRPTIVDDKGNRRKSLPKPGVKDDARLATVALHRFAGLKQDTEVLLTGQLHRWETAMCTRSHWPLDAFRDCFVRHHLLGPLARRLVWLCRFGDEVAAFRVAEDDSFATVTDAEFSPPPASQMSVAHPVDIADELPGWREVFADYEILQPFEQLNRQFHRLDADELDGPVLHRFTGRQLPGSAITGLLLRGWHSGARDEEHLVSRIVRPLPSGHEVVISIDPGLALGTGQPLPRQTITEVRVDRDEAEATPPNLHELDPVMISELITELTQV